MSQQQKNKKIQRYEPKPVQRMCSNCKWFKSDKVTTDYGYRNYVKEINIRCTLPDLGGFTVKKMGLCSMYEKPA